MGTGITGWYREAEDILVEVTGAVQHQRAFSLSRLEALAATLVSSLQHNDELLVEALSGPSGSPLITNLINVGILGTKIGIGLGYYGAELSRLALAGLLHDIGLFTVPISLVTKTSRLTTEERALIEQHPELGYQVILRCGSGYQWLAQLVRHAHERVNGQGYPNRLRGQDISEMALILGVVDVFDALISERPYRNRLLPHEAVKEILVAERTTFPREIQKALVEQLSVYPLGTVVRLTTDEVGTVVKINTRYPTRPVVRMDESPTDTGMEIRQTDLSHSPLIAVVEVIQRPVVGSIRFPNTPSDLKTSLAPGSASNQFTSLLESLDAIAGSIQNAVKARASRGGQSDIRDTR